MEYIGINTVNNKYYKLSDEIKKVIHTHEMNRNGWGINQIGKYRIIINQDPTMASIDQCYTIYNTLTKEYILVRTTRFLNHKPMFMKIIKSKYLFNDKEFNRIMKLINFKNPMYQVLNTEYNIFDTQINNENKINTLTNDESHNYHFKTKGISNENFNYFNKKYFEIRYDNYTGKMLRHPEVESDGLCLIEDGEYRIAKFDVNGTLFIYNKEQNILQQKKMDEFSREPNPLHLQLVARVLMNDNIFRQMQKDRVTYNKIQILFEKHLKNDIRKNNIN